MSIRQKNFVIKKRLFMVREYESVKAGTSKFQTVKEICTFLCISRKTLYKRYNRFIENDRDEQSLLDRSSAPSVTRRIPQYIERSIISIRDKLGWSSKRIQLEMKRRGVVNPATGKPVSEGCIVAVFKRNKRGYKYDKQRRRAQEPPVVRYEKEKPGELGHIDYKKLKNVAGCDPRRKKYECALLDDCTRIAYVEILPDKKAKTAANFLKRATEWFKRKYGIVFEKLLSDNGKEFTYHTESGRRYHPFEVMCRRLGIVHKRTRVRRPQTNGKVERLWRTMNAELYNVVSFKSLRHRSMELARYLRFYNHRRLHMGIRGMTPYEKFQEVA